MQPVAIIIFSNHMDLVWKRPFADYAEIECDIINKALDLLARYPEFTFYLEQTATIHTFLAWHPERRPALEKYIAEGRLEIIGGAWALIDLNLPPGECMARNYLLGLRYLRETLGIRPDIGCQADAFGQGAQLPQILAQFGFRRLVNGRNVGAGANNTTVSDLPFAWVGADGSRVINGFRDAGTPFGFYEPNNTAQTIAAVREKLARVTADTPLTVCCLTSEEVLPQRNVVEALLELAREERALTVKFGTLAEYYARLDELTVSGAIRLREFHGEFNPVFTGCYTMRSAIKQANTRLVNQALTVEAAWCCAGAARGIFDAQRLDAAWRLLLLNQFHDSMGGCVSASAFADIMRRYDDAACELDAVRREVSPSAPGGARLFNPLPYTRSAIVRLDTERAVAADGRPVPQVRAADGLYVRLEEMPPLGTVELTDADGEPPEQLRAADRDWIENEFYRVELKDGAIGRVMSRRDDTLTLTGAIGELLVREDRGGFWTTRPTGVTVSGGRARTVSVETSTLLQRVTLSGSLRGVAWDAELRCDWEQEVRLWRGGDRIDVIYRVDWAGGGADLSALIPLPFPAREASYDTPFAVWRRSAYEPVTEPFSANRGGEWPSVRFVSADGGDWGVTVVHEALHGIQHGDGRLLLNLLHSPDPRNYECGTIWIDQAQPVGGILHDEISHEHGRHEFRFSLRLHRGDWQSGAALRLAENLHQSPLTVTGPVPNLPLTVSLPANVGYSALKPAESGDGVVLRLWEASGADATATVSCVSATAAWRCNLNEERLSPLTVTGGQCTVRLAPYEIATVLFTVSGG